MSSTSSAASADSVSDSKGPGCEQSRSVKSTPTPEPSSQSIGQAFHATQTYASSAQLDFLPMESDPLTSYAAASPAKTSASHGTDLVWPGKGLGCGGSTPVWLASYDLATSSWRTSQRCLVEGLEKFSETWPRSGMTQNGTAYQLPTLAPLTNGIASGLLPTPCASEPGWKNIEVVDKNGNPPTHFNQRFYDKKTGRLVQKGLTQAARIWRTPTASDATKWNNQSMADRLEKGQSLRLCTQVSPEGGRGGSLNPTWVEWLMGFPLGWTALDASEMPSSRRYRKSSGERS